MFFYLQCFLQNKLFLLAQLNITTVKIGRMLLRAPLVMVTKTLLSIYSQFSLTLSNISRPKKLLRVVVHARGNCSKGLLKERIMSVQLEANSGEGILKIFLKRKRILNLSQDHLSIRAICSSNTQIMDVTSFTNTEVKSVPGCATFSQDRAAFLHRSWYGSKF